ncbi:MAG TPA: phosphate propanoyltransferase [Patescibacteria group bacterium]
MKVLVEVSARHVHLDRDTFAALFGQDATLSKLKDLSQPKQFAANEVVSVKTKKGRLDKVRILGPLRSYTQVELSKTDARILGVETIIRDSDELDLDGTAGATLIGPKGELKIDKGVITPWRHLHISSLEATSANINDGQLLKVRVGGLRGIVFEKVLVRVKPQFKLSMHIDTDEGNAVGIGPNTIGEILL